MNIYNSVITDAPTSAFDETDYKKFKLQTTPLKSNCELSVGRQNTTTTAAMPTTSSRITFSMFDSINL